MQVSRQRFQANAAWCICLLLSAHGLQASIIDEDVVSGSASLTGVAAATAAGATKGICAGAPSVMLERPEERNECKFVESYANPQVQGALVTSAQLHSATAVAACAVVAAACWQACTSPSRPLKDPKA